MIQATIELADRAEEYVQLGATSAGAVRLTGVLTTAGEPIEGMMQWIGECADPMGSQVVAKSNAEGYYEVELPFPGACPLHVDPLIGVYNPFVTAAGSPGSSGLCQKCSTTGSSGDVEKL